MGTRSMTSVQDEEGREIVRMYRHMDGYPRGHGQDLVTFLQSRVLCDGLTETSPGPGKTWANRMDCLAAQMVAAFKKGPGGIYLVAPDGEPEEWNYHVTSKQGVVHLQVLDWDGRQVWDGPVNQWDVKRVEQMRETLNRLDGAVA